MTNQAWECPRCNRMNAPFNPTCVCDPTKVKNPLYTFDELDQCIKNSQCTNCGSYHGMFQGRAVQCMDLKHNFSHAVPLIKSAI